MKAIVALALATVCAASVAQPAHAPAYGARAKAEALCRTCGVVQQVREERRKGEGGAAGVIGGAVVGGLLGNQVGRGTGNALATAGGAVAGAYVGNEVQKKVSTKTVWVTHVKMHDGSVRTFEHATRPGWKVGTVVRLDERDGLVLR